VVIGDAWSTVSLQKLPFEREANVIPSITNTVKITVDMTGQEAEYSLASDITPILKSAR
jgi:hypothetical protein